MNASAQTACPRCNSALPAGAQFCGACGSALGAPPQPPPQAYAPPPPMPSMPNVAARFSGGGGGNTKQVNVAATAPDAFNTAMNILQGAEADVHWSQPPQAAKFVLTRKSFWSTGGMPIKYDGDLQVSPVGPGQSSVRLSLKVRWGSAGGLMIGIVGFVVIGAMFNPWIMYSSLLLIAVCLGTTAWTVGSSLPEKALKELTDKIAMGGGAVQAPVYTPAPQPQAYAAPPAHPPAYGAPTPPAAAPTPTPAPAAPAAMDDSAKIMEQIKQLGTLRDAGVLTPAEFEAKKAELLARL